MLKEENPDMDLTALDTGNLTESQQEQVDNLILLVTQENKEALESASTNLQYETADQLAQSATTLASITANIAGDGVLSKTLDMQGREVAVNMIAVREKEQLPQLSVSLEQRFI